MKEELKFAFAGDIMLGRRVIVNDRLFEDVKEIFTEADIAFANLESPFCDDGNFIDDKKYVFSAKKKYCSLLKSAGFDVVSLANNHIIDCIEKGVTSTTEILDKIGILFTGLERKPLIIEKKGIKIGFLAYCKKIRHFKKVKNSPNVIDENILEDIVSAKKDVDILIVSLHWGREYKTEPDAGQEKLAKKLVDAGADIVVGHHAHKVQKTERYGNGIIAYNLGNFVFDQMFNKDVRKGAILKVTADEKGVNDFSVISSYIDDGFKVVLD
ncbi:hypothetical protein GF336_02785 [Candidatus Woesearchaeota archaeon]|nr:hypothetical protein [Candidatus Woesearchaeota archaeon]